MLIIIIFKRSTHNHEDEPLICIPAYESNRSRGKPALGDERLRQAAGIMRGVDSELDAGKSNYLLGIFSTY